MNKEGYGIKDFIVDCNQDIAKIRLCVDMVKSVCSFFGTFSLVWSYISILLFAFYGVYQGYTTGLWTFSVTVFSVCAVMLIANTVLLCLRSHDHRADGRRTSALHVFRWITVFLKLVMSVITVYSLIGVGNVASAPHRAVICIVSVFWLGVTLTVDLVFFLFTLFGRILRTVVEERVDRVKVVAARVTDPVAKGVHLVQRVTKTLSPHRLITHLRTRMHKRAKALPPSDEAHTDKPVDEPTNDPT